MNLTGLPPRQKHKPTESKALRRASRGAECTLKIPGVCSHDPEQTVGCHLRLFGFGGIGSTKPSDLFIIDACAACHSVLDNRDKWAGAALGHDDLLRALMQTLAAREAAGLIEVKS